jgi:outer membrane protein TolC
MFIRFIISLLLLSASLYAQGQSRSLNFYLDEGIRNSPLLKDYSNQVNSAMIDSLLIRAARLPQVEAKSQLLYSPAYKNFGYDEVVTDGGNYQAVVGVSQAILNKRELSNKYQSVNIQRQYAVNSSRISVAELKRIITDQYLVTYTDYSDLTFNKSFLGLAYKENDIIRQFVINGLCKQTDYLSLQIETQTLEILVNQLKNQFEKDIRLLNRLCGLSDTVVYELVLPALEIKGNNEVMKSPLYIQYKLDSLRIANEMAGIDIKYRLKMNWFADAGFLTATPSNFYRHFGYSAGVSLSIPVYDGRQREKEKQKLSLAEDTRGSYQDNFRKQYYQQIKQFTDELKSLQVLSVQFENQLSTSQKLVDALKGQLESGIIQMTEFINAIKNYRNINKSLSDNRIRIQQVINELNYLLTQ